MLDEFDLGQYMNLLTLTSSLANATEYSHQYNVCVCERKPLICLIYPDRSAVCLHQRFPDMRDPCCRKLIWATTRCCISSFIKVLRV